MGPLRACLALLSSAPGLQAVPRTHRLPQQEQQQAWTDPDRGAAGTSTVKLSFCGLRKTANKSTMWLAWLQHAALSLCSNQQQAQCCACQLSCRVQTPVCMLQYMQA